MLRTLSAALLLLALVPPSALCEEPVIVTENGKRIAVHEGRRFSLSFDANMEKFAAYDAAHPEPSGIVFVGSSSFVGWKTLERDMAPLPVINRAFGGSNSAQLWFYADRAVLARKPRIVVVYIGDNDMPPAAVTVDNYIKYVRLFIERVRGALPDTRFVFVSSKLSVARWNLRDKYRAANAALKALCEADPRLSYADITPTLLDATGTPRPDRFVADKLHIKPEVYADWTAIVRPVVERLWNSLQAEDAATAAAVAASIVENGDFEVGGQTTVAGLSTHFFQGTYDFTVVTQSPHSGRRCISISAPEAGWARWYTTDVFLLAGARYRLSCWVRSAGPAGARIAGDVWVCGCGTNARLFFGRETAWKRLSQEFTATATGRGGLYLQNMGVGQVFFDDVAVEMIAPPPAPTGEAVPTDAKPLTAIVIPAEPRLHHLFLATEAQRLLREMTGKTVAICPGRPATPGRGLYLGLDAPGTDFGADIARLADEGILVDIGDNLTCQGKTPRALNYATYELFRMLGCRWYMPGPRGTVIPRVARLTLTPAHLVHNPSFTLRGGTVIQVEARPPKFTLTGVNEEQYMAWAVANHMNRLKAAYPQSWNYGAIHGSSWEEYAGHTYAYLIPPEKYWPDHPEYWPLVKGKRTHLHSSGRPAELCVSNPDVQRLMTAGALDYFASHPYGMRFCINADDEPSYWCECDACRALDTVPNDFAHQGNGVLNLTDRCMTLVNTVAAAVQQEYPGRWVGTFAYGSTREVPRKVKPADNVMVELTWWDRCFKHAMTDPTCKVNAKGLQRLRDWQRWTEHITIYGYLQYPHWDVPQVFASSEADFLRTIYRRGVRCVTDEWDTSFVASALLLSLRARLLWDINTDVDAFIEDFCGKLYGPAAGAMRSYYRRMEQAVAESPQPDVSFRGLGRFTPQVLRECRRELRRAYLIAHDDLTRARVMDQWYGLNMVELYQGQAKPQKTVADQVALSQLNDRILAECRRHDIALGMDARNALYVDYKPPLAALAAARLLQLPEQWQFRIDPGNEGEAQQWFAPGKVDAAWKPISIHKAWEEQGYAHDGYGWYALDVKLPGSPAGPVWLLFEAIDETCDVWINGVKVGESKGDAGVLWDKPVAVEVTGKYRPDASNHVVVRVHDSAYAGGIWKPVWLVGSR